MPETGFFWIWRKLVKTQTFTRCTPPTVLRVPVPYHPGFYLPLALLDLALLAFILSTITAVVRGKIKKTAPATER